MTGRCVLRELRARERRREAPLSFWRTMLGAFGACAFTIAMGALVFMVGA